MVAEQWEVWLTPCAQSITVPITAAASLDELKEAVLNSCLVAAPELVPVSWLDASRIRQSMVLSARADAGDLTAIRFDDLRTLTPALQADVVPAEEAAALALLQAEEQRRQALGEAAALEALAFARANPLPPPLRSVPFLLKRTVPMYGIGIAWGAQYAKVRPLLQELGLPPWALSVAWLAGPISGLVVQPLVGQLSDRTRGSSRCFAGKRRQWMWTGGLGLSASLLLMTFCSNLGLALGDAGNSTHPAALVLAVLAFWSAHFFLNALQGPARTLVVDAAPPEQQALALTLTIASSTRTAGASPHPHPSQFHPSSRRERGAPATVAAAAAAAAAQHAPRHWRGPSRPDPPRHPHPRPHPHPCPDRRWPTRSSQCGTPSARCRASHSARCCLTSRRASPSIPRAAVPSAAARSSACTWWRLTSCPASARSSQTAARSSASAYSRCSPRRYAGLE